MLLRWTVVAACLVASAIALTGSAAPHEPVRVLQLNLCASGMAACYTGRSVTEAATVLRATGPDVVTLNEVCAGDVATLGRVFADLHRGDAVSAFMAAPDRPSGRATRCRDGQDYGIGLLVRGRDATTRGGVYPVQDPVDPEERVWLCASGAVVACTTHLASADPAATLAQCRHLLDTVVPAASAGRPAVVAGDLNLRYGAAPDLRPCLSGGYVRLDSGDAGLQHVLATPGLAGAHVREVDLHGTTDHPGLLVTLTVTGHAPRPAGTAP